MIGMVLGLGHIATVIAMSITATAVDALDTCPKEKDNKAKKVLEVKEILRPWVLRVGLNQDFDNTLIRLDFILLLCVNDC